MKILNAIVAVLCLIAMMVCWFQGNIVDAIINGILAIFNLIAYEVSE